MAGSHTLQGLKAVAHIDKRDRRVGIADRVLHDEETHTATDEVGDVAMAVARSRADGKKERGLGKGQTAGVREQMLDGAFSRTFYGIGVEPIDNC